MSSVIISSLPYPARFIRKLRRSSLLVPQSEHYCQNGVVVQSLTGILAKDLSEIRYPRHIFFQVFIQLNMCWLYVNVFEWFTMKYPTSLFLCIHSSLYRRVSIPRKRYSKVSHEKVFHTLLYHATENPVLSTINASPQWKVRV